MKTTTRLFRIGLTTLGLVVAIACSKDDSSMNPTDPTDPTDPTNPSGSTIAEVIASGDEFETFPETQMVDTISNDGETERNFDTIDENDDTLTERFVCTKRRVSIEDGSEDFFMFSPNESLVYPGNLIQGKTKDNGTPESIPLARGGGVISYNLLDGNPVTSVPVEQISISSVRDAQNQIIAGSILDGDPSVPADFSLSIESVQSKEELALKMGVKFRTFNAKVSSQLQVSTSATVNSVLVKLTQRFYTMDVDIPTSPDTFFDESVTAEQLGEYVQPDNPATYIQSVTYGRIFYMLFESTASTSDMKAKLEAGYRTLGTSTEGEVEYDSFRSLQDLTLQVIAYGGNAEETLDAVGNFTDNQDIGDFLAKIGKSSDIRTGKPLSYILNSVERPSRIVGAKLATEFDIETCELRGVYPPPGFLPLLDLFDDDGNDGGIGAMFQVRDGDIILFNKAGTRYAWYDGNDPIVENRIKGQWDITDTDGPIGGTTFNSIGACTRFSDTQIYIFNENGLAAEIFNYNPNAAPNSGPIGSYVSSGGANTIFSVNEIFGDSGGFPYTNQGFVAGARFDLGGRKIFFGDDGSTYALYNSTGNGSWGPEVQTTLFGGGNGATLFEKVGASTFISFGGGSGGWLFINDKGNEMMEYKVDTDSFNGPWVIN
ncbi:MAG: thiol-activated cytolysin family protein [Bacteroidota bacterium]